MTLNEVNAYAAGILDGEGSVQVAVSISLGLRVTVGSTNEEVLAFLQAYFGGRVHKGSKATDYHKASWNWMLYMKEARPFLEAVRPYCIIKRMHVLLGLAFLNTAGPPGAPLPPLEEAKRLRITATLRFLNKKGPRRPAKS